ncbi:MAG: glycosyltransferase family 4 protein [Bacteroidetes bacterium]|nr:glycosyltransferase family 4 protein [Bacteroidota bacterium]
MKKVLIITYYWPPSGGGGVQRWVKFVKYLPKYQIEPIVLTVSPDCASYALIDSSLSQEVEPTVQVFHTKSREPFNFYKKLTAKKEIPFGGFANEDNPGFLQKVSRFIRGNFFIPDARIGWNSFAYEQAEKLIKEFGITTVITSSPPHSTQLIGLKLKRKLGIHWIADLRDPWIDIYYYNKMFHSQVAKRIDRKKELEVLQNADSIVVVSNSIKELFASKVAVNGNDKISVVANGFDMNDFPDRYPNTNSKFTIVYTGTLAENYHIEGFLNAMMSLVENYGTSKFALQFVGRVTEKYRQFIEGSVLNSICNFVGHVDHKTSVGFLQQADALFLAIPDVSQNEGILTGKLFEYLAARRPIVAVGPVDGDASAIIRECEAGKMFEYTDEKLIVNYLTIMYLKWIESPSQYLTGRSYLNYSREELTKKLAKLIPID